MRYATVLATALLLSSCLAFAKTKAKGAHADLKNAKGEKVGTARLTSVGEGAKIQLKVFNLSPGVHAFHIHAVGKCDPPDFKTAGGHFNPQGKKHGLKNPQGPHAGDMENITVGPKGTAKVTILDPRVSLGEGPNSLFQPDGTAIVIHAKADDGMTDPAGNAGDRIACGVITR